MLVSAFMFKCSQKTCSKTSKCTMLFNLLAFCAFELMYVWAILGVAYRNSREGSVCSGDFRTPMLETEAEANGHNYRMVFYERSGMVIHVSSVILVTIGSLANLFGLYGSFYFYNQDED